MKTGKVLNLTTHNSAVVTVEFDGNEHYKVLDAEGYYIDALACDEIAAFFKKLAKKLRKHDAEAAAS